MHTLGYAKKAKIGPIAFRFDNIFNGLCFLQFWLIVSSLTAGLVIFRFLKYALY